MAMKVYEKDRKFQIATTKGWMAAEGTQINIYGIDFAFCLIPGNENVTVIVFEVESGTLMIKGQVSVMDVIACSTREKTVDFFKNKVAEALVLQINKFGIENGKGIADRDKK
ncbi:MULTISPECIES: hypothetical protein [Listeria]|uniref:hypothetical protein n=1 Tax=Listeria TaxID=1637 RepID=UPI0001B42532|nr:MULTISPECIES: hypothetical protein [Listeria]EHC6275928.1 hypothetical protein [Listeria monocytogenes serotype 1/2b]AQP69705.1 hypothetical protein B0X27_00565 [Listeria monocytogenes]EAD0713025.1 hypothetical protein [Listeria monocytogenes]EAG9254146.1 hypothetical protein [Listeria monocytogenes]EAW7161186.1 hypothetical protein [Listeria monocytogenes]